MGLDMYLYRQVEGAPSIHEQWNDIDMADEDWFAKAGALKENIEVAYWRKANAIHSWFVTHFQDGVDECQYSQPIGREQLAGLVQRCKRILAGENPADLLPSQGGFFFGNTDYDEGYMMDIKDTITQLEPLLSEHNSDVFIYQSSW